MASIRKRGNSYQITVSMGRDINGKQIREMTTFTPDPDMTPVKQKKALDNFIYEFEKNVLAGKVFKGEKLTFNEFAKKWLKEHAEQHLEATSLSNYKQHLEIRILPAIGHLKLADITPLHLQGLYNNLTEDGVRSDGKPGGYSYQTIKKTHAVISSIMQTAVYWQMIESNPCDRVQVPNPGKSKENKVKCFTAEQAEAFLKALEKEHATIYRAHDQVDDTGIPYHVPEYTQTHTIPEQLKVFFYMSLFGGFRRGELLALTWDDIDFNSGTVTINKSSAYVDGKTIIKSPKSIKSNRVIMLPDHVMAALKRWKISQATYRMQIGDQWAISERNGLKYIFIQWDGKQMCPSTPYHAFKRIISRYNEAVEKEKDKLPNIPLHGLRHTSASLLISKNIDIQTISGRLGHSNSNVTLGIYAHSFRKMDEAASAALTDILNVKNQ